MQSVHTHGGGHQARDICVKVITITVLVLSVITLITGILACLVSSGHGLHALGNIGLSHSYLMMGGATILMAFSIAALVRLARPLHEIVP